MDVEEETREDRAVIVRQIALVDCRNNAPRANLGRFRRHAGKSFNHKDR
jgi:hypothetical protein